MALNWAMIAVDGKSPVPLPQEKVFFSQEKVNVVLDIGGGYPGNAGVYKASGTVFVTNQRVVFISWPTVEFFKSLSAPLTNLREGKLVQPFFGANYYQAQVLPVPSGGMPSPGQLKITFKEGGGFEFNTIYNELLRRLAEIEGRAPPETYEPLPTYTPREEEPAAGSSSAASVLADVAVAAAPAVLPYAISQPEPDTSRDPPATTNPGHDDSHNHEESVAPPITPLIPPPIGADELPPSYDEITK